MLRVTSNNRNGLRMRWNFKWYTTQYYTRYPTYERLWTGCKSKIRKIIKVIILDEITQVEPNNNNHSGKRNKNTHTKKNLFYFGSKKFSFSFSSCIPHALALWISHWFFFSSFFIFQLKSDCCYYLPELRSILEFKLESVS